MQFSSILLGILLGYIIFKVEKSRELRRNKKNPGYQIQFGQYCAVETGPGKSNILACVGSAQIGKDKLPLFQQITSKDTFDIETFEKCATMNKEEFDLELKPRHVEWVKTSAPELLLPGKFKEHYDNGAKVWLLTQIVALTKHGPYIETPKIQTIESLTDVQTKHIIDFKEICEDLDPEKQWYYINGFDFSTKGRRFGDFVPEDMPLFVYNLNNSF